MSKRNNKTFESSPEDRDPKKIRMEDLKDSISQIVQEIKSLKTVVTETNCAVNKNGASLEMIATDLSTIKEKFELMKHEIAKLQEANESTTTAVNIIQQAMLRKSFTIMGIPPTAAAQGDVFPTFKKICASFGFNAERDDFRKLFIVQHRNKQSSHIAGEFYYDKKRDDAFKAFKLAIRNKRPILTDTIFTDLPLNSPFKGKELRLRTQLTQATRQLLEKTRTFKDHFTFVWENEGRILVKKRRTVK